MCVWGGVAGDQVRAPVEDVNLCMPPAESCWCILSGCKSLQPHLGASAGALAMLLVSMFGREAMALVECLGACSHG